MLILENLRRIGDLIYVEYYYDNSEDRGSLIYSITNREYVEIKYNKRDSESPIKYGFGKIKLVLNRIIDAGNYSDYYEYFWY